MSRVLQNMLKVKEVMAVLEEAGGVVQPLVFDSDKFEIYAEIPAARQS